MTQKRSIGLVGTNGAGKSTACDYFKAKGYTILSLSDALRDHLRQLNLPLDRDTLTNTSNTLKNEKGADILAKMVFKLSQQYDTPIAFDSIRHPDELSFLKSQSIYFIGITAPIEIRYERIKSRNRETDHVDFDTFQAQDLRELNGSSSGQNITHTLDLCDTILQNDSSIDALHRKLDSLYGTL
jgi:dephospho-CoA kinase